MINNFICAPIIYVLVLCIYYQILLKFCSYLKAFKSCLTFPAMIPWPPGVLGADSLSLNRSRGPGGPGGPGAASFTFFVKIFYMYNRTR